MLLRLTFLFVVAAIVPGRLAAGELVNSASVFDGHLFCVYFDETFCAWDLKTGNFTKDISTQFSRKELTSLATDGEKLWGADRSNLYRWSRDDRAWKKAAEFDGGIDSLVEIVIVDSSPFLVFPSKVLDPINKHTFKMPVFKTYPPEGPWMRILATHGTNSMLWIGTGNGEWGGRLIGLDPKTGKWVSGDGNGYVTGITHATNSDEVLVSWSMSHFGAHTQIQIHKADGTVKTKYAELESKYYQQIVYNSYDRTLYGIESDEVVTIKDGKPLKVAKLDGTLYSMESNAIGVAPGIRALIPFGPKMLVIVPKRGNPWLLREKELIRLRKP